MPKSQFIDPAEIRKSGTIHFEDIPVNAYNKTIEEEKKNYSNEDFLRIYRDMSILHEFENMLNQIKVNGEYNSIKHTYPGPAHLGYGQEAAAVGQAYLLEKDDQTFGSHRSHEEILAKGLAYIYKAPEDELMETMKNFNDGKTLAVVEKYCDAKDIKELAIYFLVYGTATEVFARENGWLKGLGGSMHAFFEPFGIYPNNAIVGGAAPISTGAALFKKVNHKNGIVICNIGDGSIGCGPVYESMNFACMDQYRQLWEESKRSGMPIIYNINNNGYGMGGQTAGETMAYEFVARLGAGITPNQMHAERIDGYNPLAVIDAYKRKLEIVRNGDGPVLLDVITYRHTGHSTSDANAYRTKEEIDAWDAADPLNTMKDQLIEADVATRSDFEKIWEKTTELLTTVTRLAADKEISPYLDFKKNPHIIDDIMYSNQKVAKMEDREPEVLAPKESCSRVKQIAGKERFYLKDGKEVSKIKSFNIRDALFEPIIDKYYEDPTLISYGEDVRDWGGAFAVYRGLNEVIPQSRLFNSPISEAAIVGTAVGYAIAGGRAVVELMYTDFMGRCGDEIFNQMAKWQAMSAGILKMPLVLRLPNGSKYGAQHSQDWVAMAAHVPGLKVVFPVTPYEAKGLMTYALNSTDPFCFFESQRIYDKAEMFHEGGVPKESYEIEPGEVDLIRSGSDVTILTIGATLYRAVDAADILQKEYNISAEIINLCSLVPLKYEKILESVKKTGKVVLASDACARGTFLNDVAMNITSQVFDYLDAPPAVVGSRNWITPPYEFDEEFFPQASWIIDAIHEKIMPIPGYQPTSNSYMPVEEMIRAAKGL